MNVCKMLKIGLKVIIKFILLFIKNNILDLFIQEIVGDKIDWLEHLFVKPEYQNKGIGTQVIQLVEEIVKQYSISLYIEAASRNEKVIRLYRRLGYDCLNTISIRKDFNQDDLECVKHEKIYDLDFEIRKVKSD